MYFSQHKLILVAIVASLIMHIVLINEFSINLPQFEEDKLILEAELINLQPLPKTERVLPKQDIPTPKPASPENSAASDIQPEPETVPDKVPVINDLTEPPAPGTLSSASLNIEPIETSTDSPDIADSAQDEATDKNLDNEPQKIIFTHVETEFEVKRGINTSVAGVTKITFNYNENNTYSIYSHTQASGLASLFFGDLVQKSEGSVNGAGLRPDFYSYQYGNDSKKLQSAHFNWNDNILNLHNSKGDSTVKLTEGTQDFLSFMYQFMFNPPLNNMQITMTNGKKIRTYYYSFEGEETLNSKLGELKTVHLVKSGTEDEKTEIWLATDYNFLPVRIVKTEKDGTVIEQLAVSMTTKN